MKMDYDILSKDYDLTREANFDTLKSILSKIEVNNKTTLLDFGCGTGNYACAIKEMTNANIFGVEPSDGMRQKAQEKRKDICFVKGDHTSIPYESNFFDFAYMTDVIHHIPDLNVMFSELYRVLKQDGLLCIITQSHSQIESRFWSPYFPATVTEEKKIYPEIPKIIEVATNCGFHLDEEMIINTESKSTISDEFLNLVKNKGFSMFRLISDDDFDSGFLRLQSDHDNKVIITSNYGQTLVWLRKN